MKKLLIISILLFGFLWLVWRDFGNDYTININQNIGGKLVCDVAYRADIHKYWYDIGYTYIDINNKSHNIGYGTYYSRHWKENEQLIQYGDWLILKTGERLSSDKIIIGKLKLNNWEEYVFSPKEIEKTNLWKSQNNEHIHSLLNYLPSESYITKIENGYITVLYKFRQNATTMLGKRLIIYHINIETGIPKLLSINK